MKALKNNLSEIIQLYLEDTESYGEENDFILAESTLSPLKNLIMESKSSFKSILNETYKKSTKEQKSIIEDFSLYIDNM
jgi:hypothetical protein